MNANTVEATPATRTRWPLFPCTIKLDTRKGVSLRRHPTNLCRFLGGTVRWPAKSRLLFYKSVRHYAQPFIVGCGNSCEVLYVLVSAWRVCVVFAFVQTKSVCWRIINIHTPLAIPVHKISHPSIDNTRSSSSKSQPYRYAFPFSMKRWRPGHCGYYH